ncbi:TPA: transcriptional regulator, partial [Staphylococcus aureus]|nr:transcriptional regulator [Staphylococcus aureus]
VPKSRITEERSIHQETIAGHANKDEFTPEEWEEIENFMQWVRDRKK